jgi:ATP-dependent Lhr-like helicase
MTPRNDGQHGNRWIASGENWDVPDRACRQCRNQYKRRTGIFGEPLPQFLATHRESLIRAAGLLRLWKEGYVDELQPPPLPYPVVAQQIMAIIRQQGAASRHFDGSSVWRATSQAGEIIELLMAHMLEREILFEDSGVVGLGPVGEKLFGAKNYMALMSVFDTPFLFQVTCGVEELGWVHPLSFTGFGQRSVVISLGGRAWEVTSLDEERSVAHVRPADAPGRSRWLGESRALNYRLCRAIRGLLAGDQLEPIWSRRAVDEITMAREEVTVARSIGTVIASDGIGERAKWWTFGGLKANASLAAMLISKGGCVPRFDNYFVEIPDSPVRHEAEKRFQEMNMNQPHEVRSAAEPPGRVKFWECIPSTLQARFMESRFTDMKHAGEILSEPRLYAAPANESPRNT